LFRTINKKLQLNLRKSAEQGLQYQLKSLLGQSKASFEQLFGLHTKRRDIDHIAASYKEKKPCKKITLHHMAVITFLRDCLSTALAIVKKSLYAPERL
jgi:hypothetical protein